MEGVSAMTVSGKDDENFRRASSFFDNTCYRRVRDMDLSRFVCPECKELKKSYIFFGESYYFLRKNVFRTHPKNGLPCKRIIKRKQRPKSGYFYGMPSRKLHGNFAGEGTGQCLFSKCVYRGFLNVFAGSFFF